MDFFEGGGVDAKGGGNFWTGAGWYFGEGAVDLILGVSVDGCEGPEAGWDKGIGFSRLICALRIV